MPLLPLFAIFAVFAYVFVKHVCKIITSTPGVMTVKAETLQNFVGVVHSRDFRKAECSGYGENTKVTYLRINMLAEKDDKDYCGVFTQVSDLLVSTAMLYY
jgi:CBS domain containing-hemolysin-like protein